MISYYFSKNSAIQIYILQIFLLYLYIHNNKPAKSTHDSKIFIHNTKTCKSMMIFSESTFQQNIIFKSYKPSQKGLLEVSKLSDGNVCNQLPFL